MQPLANAHWKPTDATTRRPPISRPGRTTLGRRRGFGIGTALRRGLAAALSALLVVTLTPGVQAATAGPGGAGVPGATALPRPAAASPAARDFADYDLSHQPARLGAIDTSRVHQRATVLGQEAEQAPADDGEGAVAPAPSGTPGAWRVTDTGGQGARLRATPSTTAEVVDLLPDGTVVEPLEGPVSADGLDWRRVSVAGIVGWVSAELLDAPSTAPAPQPSPGTAVWIVAETGGQGANLRASPSSSAEIVGALEDNTVVQLVDGPVSEDGRAWRKVSGAGLEGWVLALYIWER
jgi:SH3-like domain-containing protein